MKGGSDGTEQGGRPGRPDPLVPCCNSCCIPPRPACTAALRFCTALHLRFAFTGRSEGFLFFFSFPPFSREVMVHFSALGRFLPTGLRLTRHAAIYRHRSKSIFLRVKLRARGVLNEEKIRTRCSILFGRMFNFILRRRRAGGGQAPGWAGSWPGPAIHSLSPVSSAKFITYRRSAGRAARAKPGEARNRWSWRGCARGGEGAKRGAKARPAPPGPARPHP